MHLLATTTGVVDGGATAVDLKQSPGDIVILTAADSELAALALASDQLPEKAPNIRLANLLQLQHNYSVDLYTDQTLASAKLIIVRLLGGKAYWPYGVDRLVELAGQTGLKLALLPGGTDQDFDLKALSTVSGEDWDAKLLCKWWSKEYSQRFGLCGLDVGAWREAKCKFTFQFLCALPLIVVAHTK
jgi:cobaltochelatase CobN